MDLSLTNEQEQLVDAFDALYSRLATPERVRAAEPLGFDSDLWRTLVDAGVVEMAVDEQAGGWGASVLDLALVAERHGRAVAPAPLIETQIAAFALAQCDDDAGRTPLQAVLSGKHIISFAPRPGRGDVLSLVPGGAVADAVVAFVDGRLLLVSLKTRRRPPPINNLAAMPLSDVAIPDDVSVLAEGECAAQVYGAALDRWLALTALALVGIAGRAVEMGSEYAKQRSAFDVPIGQWM
jgi:alkylation response protein AidB-like acyl-CoA dehydrogenase